MKFYDRIGCELSDIEDFIKLYEPSYFLGGDKIPGVSQSSYFVEKRIEDILFTTGIREQLHVVQILAWKIGKIKHGESESASEFRYAKDWDRAKDFDVTRYGRKFDIEKIANYMVENIIDLEHEAKTNPQNVLDKLNQNGIWGLGSVYLVTLLYFISRGRYPIYDRFAMMAVDAISNSTKPGGIVPCHKLPGKGEKGFSTTMQDHIQPYMTKLEGIFGSEYQRTRDIDRALWVYGHLFKVR